MSYNGSGTFVINSAGQPVVTNTTISSTAFNALTADLATGLSTALTKDGQTTATANIPMGTKKLTGLGVGTANTDSITLGQSQAGGALFITAAGTADVITATGAPTITAYATGNSYYFTATGANTTNVTLNVDGLGAKAVTKNGSTALVAGDIPSGAEAHVVYDGTRFQLINPAGGGVTTWAGGTTGLTPAGATSGAVSLAGTLALTNGGTGGTSAATARTNLGLGTAAVQNTGTSGANVPLLNGANTHSGAATFSATVDVTSKIFKVNSYRVTGGVFQLYNNAGNMQLSFSSSEEGLALGDYWSQITSPSHSSVNVTTGTDSSTAMANGGKVSSANTNTFIFNTTAAQVAADTPPFVCAMGYNDTGNAILPQLGLASRNVNGVTQIRWELVLYTVAGAAFAINTTNFPAGRFMNFGIIGFCL